MILRSTFLSGADHAKEDSVQQLLGVNLFILEKQVCYRITYCLRGYCGYFVRCVALGTEKTSHSRHQKFRLQSVPHRSDGEMAAYTETGSDAFAPGSNDGPGVEQSNSKQLGSDEPKLDQPDDSNSVRNSDDTLVVPGYISKVFTGSGKPKNTNSKRKRNIFDLESKNSSQHIAKSVSNSGSAHGISTDNISYLYPSYQDQSSANIRPPYGFGSLGLLGKTEFNGVGYGGVYCHPYQVGVNSVSNNMLGNVNASLDDNVSENPAQHQSIRSVCSTDFNEVDISTSPTTASRLLLNMLNGSVINELNSLSPLPPTAKPQYSVEGGSFNQGRDVVCNPSFASLNDAALYQAKSGCRV
jgi:hypothetical protein